MEYELNDAGPCRKTLLLKFSVEDVNKAFDESYTEINNYVQIKGFRKGKAPRHTLEKRFGSQATDAAKEHLVDTNLKDTVQKEKLQIIGQITFTNMGDNPVQN
ncbi:MAG: trigger factor family protein, partial [Planctomycetes bacterium]|nr:trigger factor family protein [Planctomycetota bacterium]